MSVVAPTAFRSAARSAEFCVQPGGTAPLAQAGNTPLTPCSSIASTDENTFAVGSLGPLFGSKTWVPVSGRVPVPLLAKETDEGAKITAVWRCAGCIGTP